MQRPALPAAVRPQLPKGFDGRMDGPSVMRFCSQLDTYFELVELHDDGKKCMIAVTLLEGTAYTWYTV